MESSEHELSLIKEISQKSSDSLNDSHNYVDELKSKIQNLTNEIDTVKTTHVNELSTIKTNAKQNFENAQFQAFSKKFFNSSKILKNYYIKICMLIKKMYFFNFMSFCYNFKLKIFVTIIYQIFYRRCLFCGSFNFRTSTRRFTKCYFYYLSNT